MARYVSTKDNSIGAKLIGNGKALIAKEINGDKVVEIISDTNEVLGEILPALGEIARKIEDFILSLMMRFPEVIIFEGMHYVYTQQPKRFKGIDKVFYLCEEDPNQRMFEHEAERLPQAKRSLRKELKDLGYL
jgi:hypothetical protein